MPRQKNISYTYVNTPEKLDEALAALGMEKVVAFDMECDNNLHHYGTRICLFQFSTPRRNFVVDALADIDLKAVGRLLEDPSVEIIIHDTAFDLRRLDDELCVRPRPVFDTLVAARLVGHKSFGVSSLIEHYFNVRHPKLYQRADWSRRPLKKEKIQYAVKDTYFLLRLRRKLKKELKDLGRLEWAEEEFRLCEEIRFEPDEKPLFTKVKGARKLSPERLAVLMQLVEEREKVARELDLPVFKVISNQNILTLAKNARADRKYFKRARGLHPFCRGEGLQRFLRAVKDGLEGPPVKWPVKKGRPPKGRANSALKHLKKWRNEKAEAEGLDPDVIFPLQALRKLSRSEPFKKVMSSPPVRNWQRKRYGSEIKNMLSGG